MRFCHEKDGEAERKELTRLLCPLLYLIVYNTRSNKRRVDILRYRTVESTGLMLAVTSKRTASTDGGYGYDGHRRQQHAFAQWGHVPLSPPANSIGTSVRGESGGCSSTARSWSANVGQNTSATMMCARQGRTAKGNRYLARCLILGGRSVLRKTGLLVARCRDCAG